MSKPSTYPDFDTNATNTIAIVSGHATDGYSNSEIPSASETNTIYMLQGLWIRWFDSLWSGNTLTGDWTVTGNLTVTGDLTVDGTIKFASESLTIPAAAAQPNAVLDGEWLFSGGAWDPNGVNNTYLYFPIVLPAGCRILSWTLNAIKSSDATKSISASLYDAVGGSPTLIGSVQTNSANAPGSITLEVASVNHTLAAGHAVTLQIATNGQGAGLDFIGSLDVAYDRP